MQKYQQIKKIQDHKLGFNEIKFGDFLVAMRGILRPHTPSKRQVVSDFSIITYSMTSSSTLVENYLTQALTEETQNEVTCVLNTVLQNIINDTEITWALDDAVDIFMKTGSGIIGGNS